MLEYRPSLVIDHNPDLIIEAIRDHSDFLKFKKGQPIYLEGSTPLGVYFIKKGMVKISQFGSDGKEQIILIAKDNDMLNCSDMILSSRYSTSAEAMEDSTLYFIPKKEFWTIIKSSYSLFEQFVYLLALEIKFIERRLTNLAYKPVRGRLADALIYLSRNTSQNNPTVAISRYDLACLVGTAKETVNRLISEFRHDQMIQTEGKLINLKDPKGLLKISQMYN